MLKTQELEYKDGTTVCRGFIAEDTSMTHPKPCVLIAHDWRGRHEFFCEKAKILAQLGYVGFAIDIFGGAKLGDTLEEKVALITPFKEDRCHLASRILAAYHAATTISSVDPHRIAAIGYCFGGLAVLDLARTGADIKSAISFHGLLDAPHQTQCEKIRAKILVLHGYDDPLAPPTQVHHFAEEMNSKKVDWQIHLYGGVQHAFTNPQANDDKLGLHYNAEADKRSWVSAQAFLNETTRVVL